MNEAIKSDFINYTKLEKNELKSVLAQELFAVNKIKDKVIPSTSSIDI